MARRKGSIMYGGTYRWLAAVCIMLILSCAKQGFPPGGPVDETPPELTVTIPEAGAINVPVNTSLVFRFSEPMDEESVEENFFMVPIPSEWPSFEWSDRSHELTVHLNQELSPDATHVVSIGAKAGDLNRNGLAESVMLTFSTGNELEDKRIRGYIIPGDFLGTEPKQVSQIDVIAYRLDGSADPDPRNDIPDYVTQTGTDGTYELMGLSGGRYRLFAIGDNDGDGYYTENYDRIGIASGDIVLADTDSAVTAPTIMVAMRYTSELQLTSARAPDNSRMELYFDRPIDPERLTFEVPGLNITGWFVDTANKRMISAATEPQDERRYEITDIQAYDSDGNSLMEMEITPFFDGSDRPDTTVLALVEQIPALVSAPFEVISLTFNRVLDLPEGLSGILSADERLSLAIDRTAPNRLLLRPVSDWEYGMTYTIAFDREKLTGTAGNRLSEDAALVSIRTIPADSLTSMSGRITDNVGNGPYRVLAKDIVSGYTREITVESPGAWTSAAIQPGRYVLFAHCDNDEDDVVDLGTIESFAFAERVTAYPDTIDLEPRWPESDIILTFE